MPTPAEIITDAAVLYNDAAKQVITNEVGLRYLNIALAELQEAYEQGNIPTTNETSALINVPAGVTKVSFNGPVKLPKYLVEIQQLWESPAGLNQWTPMVRKDFLPHYLQDNTIISQFLIWAWMDDEIRLIEANADIDLKLDYIKSIFTLPITLGEVNNNLPFVNVKTFLAYRTASLLAMYAGENETRAAALNADAQAALERTLGIKIKSQQDITTRRRPFRSAYKNRGIITGR